MVRSLLQYDWLLPKGTQVLILLLELQFLALDVVSLLLLPVLPLLGRALKRADADDINLGRIRELLQFLEPVLLEKLTRFEFFKRIRQELFVIRCFAVRLLRAFYLGQRLDALRRELVVRLIFGTDGVFEVDHGLLHRLDLFLGWWQKRPCHAALRRHLQLL